MSAELEAADVIGAFRAPTNVSHHSKGSIHDDATAQKLGFKGGTVAGSLHMDQFMPQMLGIYGSDWWQKGNISSYFRQVTVDAEKVRVLARQGDPHTRIWMENEAGDLINEGTASCAGADANTELDQRLQSHATAAPGALRILAGIQVGEEASGLKLRLTLEAHAARMTTIPERLPEYEGEHPILPPSMQVNLFRDMQDSFLKLAGPAVGLFGAIELQAMNGPLRADTSYDGRFRIVALSESPKTENVWYRAWAVDPATGEDVASMLMYLRFMKASSTLWAD